MSRDLDGTRCYSMRRSSARGSERSSERGRDRGRDKCLKEMRTKAVKEVVWEELTDSYTVRTVRYTHTLLSVLTVPYYTLS